MCRFIAYSGKPILLDEVLHKPKNSLIRQSSNAHEAEEPLNGDGFGLGWYKRELDPEPGLFVSVRPAWNDRNLRYLCQKLSTECFFAHVRAASAGEVSEANCHPFHFKNLLFMHNGGIGEFNKLKRGLRRKLRDEIYDWIRGQTDSEHFFALFLENLALVGDQADVERPSVTIARVLEGTIQEIQKMKIEAGVTEACYINCVITNGDCMVAVRYVSDLREEASTLYYSEGHHYECHDGVCEMRTGTPEEHSVLIVSEKLTSHRADWKEIPTNQICIVDEQRHVHLRPLDDGLPHDEVKPPPTESRKGFRPSIVKA